MATIFDQRSKALNLWSPDETQRLRLTTVDSGFGREGQISYADGAGPVLFPGPLVYVHQDLRYTVGERIATLVQQTDFTADTLQNEQNSRIADVVSINTVTADLTARVGTLEGQHIAQEGRLDTEFARATGVEASLQTQISALLANTDAVALNSLSELIVDYRENGQGVAASLTTYQTSNDATISAYQASNDAALSAALARINLLETFIVSLQSTTSGAGD